jgi:hypothetical protein
MLSMAGQICGRQDGRCLAETFSLMTRLLAPLRESTTTLASVSALLAQTKGGAGSELGRAGEIPLWAHC